MRRWLSPKRVTIFALLAMLGIGGGVLAQQGGNNLILRAVASGSTPAIVAQGLDTNISINCIPKGTGTCQVNGAPIVTGSASTFTQGSVLFAGATGALAQDNANFFWDDTNNRLGIGTTTPTLALDVRGRIGALVGTSTQVGNVGSRIFHNVTDAPTTGTAAETLYTYTLPANALSADGQALNIDVWATTAGNANNKTLFVTFGATTIGTSTAQAFNGETMNMRCTVYRTGAATQKARCLYQSFTTGTFTANNNFVVSSSTPAETLSGTVAILVRGTTPTAAADLTANAATIDWLPIGQ